MYEKEMRLAMEAAETAGNFLLQSSDLKIDSFQDKDIKLAADKNSEAIILRILSDSGIPILSEESGMTGEKSVQKLWIIDPLDGTANYWKGLRELACVSIALWENGEPVLGVINRFQENEIYSGIVGKGAFLNGKPIRTSETIRVTDAVLATGFPVSGDYSDSGLGAFIRRIQYFRKVRMLGTAAIMGALVSAGKIDAYMEEGIMLWDIAASSAIVKAAGGHIKIVQKDGYQCVCRLFANERLQEDYNVKVV